MAGIILKALTATFVLCFAAIVWRTQTSQSSCMTAKHVVQLSSRPIVSASLMDGLRKRPFYIYEEPDIAMTSFLDKCDELLEARNKTRDAQNEFLKMAKKHPWRTRNSSEAQIFIVPIPLITSFEAGEMFKNECGGHMDRLRKAWSALTSTDTFKRRGGVDHLWLYEHFNFFKPFAPNARHFPKDLEESLRNLTLATATNFRTNPQECTRWKDLFGVCSRGNLFTEKWEVTRCALSIPFTATPVIAFEKNLTFESWKARPHRLHQRVGRANYAHGATEVRHVGEKKLADLPEAFFKSGSVHETALADEMSASRFCLTTRGDDPSSHGTYNALRAGCIPVMVSSGFSLFAQPFARMLPWSQFLIELPENKYVEQPKSIIRFIYQLHESEERRLFDAMMKYRTALLYEQHPDESFPDLPALVLTEMAERCLDL